MPKLSEVITTVLSSLDKAQHQSNKISRKLANSYKNDEIMKYFALPNASISEADITLRYAVKDIGVANDGLNAEVEDSTTESLYAARARASKIVDVMMQNEKIQNIFDDPNLNHREMVVELVDKASKTIYHGKKIGREEGEIIREIMTDFRKVFSCFPSVKEKFQETFHETADSDDFVRRTQAFIHDKICSNPEIMNVQKAANLDKDMDVIVDGDILQSLPESVIQTVHIKARVKNYHWIVDEKSSTGEFVLTD